MRSLFALAAGAVALSSLAACGGGEEAFRNNIRTQALANCRGGSNAEAASQLAAVGMTVDQLCTCAIDRYLRDATIEQIRRDSNNQLPPALRNATMQCMADHVQRSGGAGSGSTPGAAGGALTPGGSTGAALDEANRALEAATADAQRAQAEMGNAAAGGDEE